MPSSQTPNYNLNQWSADDRVLRTDFNADNAKIDAALAGKASASTVSSLQTTVNSLSASKADKSALDALKATVNQQGTTLTGKGNCQIYTTSYVGDGSRGESQSMSLTFPAVPEAVYITAHGRRLTLFPGETGTWSTGITGGGSMVTVSWSGKTVRWYATNAEGQMSENGMTYHVVALMKAG